MDEPEPCSVFKLNVIYLGSGLKCTKTEEKQPNWHYWLVWLYQGDSIHTWMQVAFILNQSQTKQVSLPSSAAYFKSIAIAASASWGAWSRRRAVPETNHRRHNLASQLLIFSDLSLYESLWWNQRAQKFNFPFLSWPQKVGEICYTLLISIASLHWGGTWIGRQLTLAKIKLDQVLSTELCNSKEGRNAKHHETDWDGLSWTHSLPFVTILEKFPIPIHQWKHTASLRHNISW